MKYSFHPDAEEEFNHAIHYYHDCRKGLGYEFVVEVYLAIERARAYPKAWHIIEGDIRRSLVNKFPFGILYSEEGNELFIIAVMHLHKKPDYWKKRN